MNKKPNILILGSGAIGSFYGGKLSLAGAKVSTVCRSDYNKVKKNGITINSCQGDFHFKPDSVIKHVSEYQLIPDYIIVATKVLPEINIPELIKDKVSKDTTIFLLQNGIEIEKPIQDYFPNNEIISGLAFICANRLEPGIIDHLDYGRLIIGKYPSGNSEKVELLNDLFNKSNVPCEIDTNIVTARWKKLIWNAPFNPISVIAGGIDTAEITDSEELLLLAENIMKEIVSLATASGNFISEEFIDKNLSDTMKMKPYKTSMLLDYENGRPMEVEAILGNTLKFAKKLNIKIPYTESLYSLLKVIDSKNIKSN